jgi:hypothetical protein
MMGLPRELTPPTDRRRKYCLRRCPDRALFDESQAKKGLTIMIISALGGASKAEGHAGVLTITSSYLASQGGPSRRTLCPPLGYHMKGEIVIIPP